MKIKANKEQLLTGIQTVLNVISPKSALPILSNILLEAQTDTLRLTATDLDIGISCEIAVNNQESGSITVPAKRFYEIIRELPADEAVITSKKNNQVHIETTTCQFKIMGLAREEFPRLPEFKDRNVVSLDQDLMKHMLHLTAFAVSNDESRYILNGILVQLSKNTVSMVATDGKRLAVIEQKTKKGSEKPISFIVPSKTIQELNRNLGDTGEVSFILGNNQVLFDLGKVIIISRLIEGEFPDYKQVMPPISEQKIKVDREALLLAVRRAALLSTVDYQAVKWEVFKNKLVISKSTPDIGESREELAVDYAGKEMIIGFNPNYLMDVLKNLQNQVVEFEVTDSEKPGVVRTDGYTYIVLPMRLG